MFANYAALYNMKLDFEHTRSIVEPAVVAQGLDSAIVHEDGAYLIMRDVTVKYHRDGTHVSSITGVVRGTFLDVSRALNAFNREEAIV